MANHLWKCVLANATLTCAPPHTRRGVPWCQGVKANEETLDVGVALHVSICVREAETLAVPHR